MPALAGRVSAGVDLISGKQRGDSDCLGHGTAMAGIVAAQPRPGSGLVGIAPEATILPIKVELGQGAPKPADLASAVSVAVSAGATIVMVPWPVDLSDRAVTEAIDRAVARAVVVVVPADTTGRVGPHRAGVLRVGGIRADDQLLAPYSPGAVDVLAPGAEVVSLSANGSGEVQGTGTDYAVPFVAGLVALVKSAAPDRSAAETTQQIESTADRGGSAPDPRYGWGVINPAAAVVASTVDPPAAGATTAGNGGAGTVVTVVIVLGCAMVVAVVAVRLRRFATRAGRPTRAGY